MPYAWQMCASCGVRYRQPRCEGKCKRCFAGFDQVGARVPGITYRRERAQYLRKQAEERARIDALRIKDEGPRPPKPVVIGHREYLVVWDGA